MHELTISQGIVNEAKKHGNVVSLTIEVGELADITADEIRSSLSRLVDWDVQIKKNPGKVACSCGYTGKPKIVERGHGYVIFECPKCGKTPAVIEGNQIILVELDVKE